MDAPSSPTPRDLHFLLDPRMQNSVALRTEKDNLTRTQWQTSLWLFPHFRAILSHTWWMKFLASLPNIPSVVTIKGVNEACPISQASWYFVFFWDSADCKSEGIVRAACDCASVSMTRISNNATDCGCHTPRTPKSATRAEMPVESSESRTTGSLITLGHAIFARSPKASRISLCLTIISPPFLQSRACVRVNGAPHHHRLRGRWGEDDDSAETEHL